MERMLLNGNSEMETFDLCIIGAGMFGSAAARHASTDPSVKVCLIGPREPTIEESQTREIFGSHYDEGRIVEVLCDPAVALKILTKESIKKYRELEKLSGIQFYYPTGVLTVGERHSPFIMEVLERNTSFDIPFVDLSQNNICAKRFPFLELAECDYPVFEDSGAGYISARKIVEAEKKVAYQQGCVIFEDVVNDVEDLAHGFHKIVTETSGVLRAKRVLLCCGAFTNLKNFKAMRKLDIKLNKEAAVMFRIPKEEAMRLCSMPPVVYMRNVEGMLPTMIGAYLLPPIQYPDGKYYLKMGHIGQDVTPEIKTLKEVQEWYNGEGAPDVINPLKKLIKKLLPNVKVEEIRSKTCLTCDSPSILPYIDRITPTVSIAAVGNGIGAAISEEVGRIAAELSVRGKWDSVLPKSLFEAIYKD